MNTFQAAFTLHQTQVIICVSLKENESQIKILKIRVQSGYETIKTDA